MKIIDSHAHIYPEKIAERATKSIGDFYDLKMNCIGSCESLLASGEEIGVEKYIVHSVAISKEKVCTINDFVSGAIKTYDKFIGFMTLHPDMSISEIEKEIDRGISLGLVGIKMHPDIQQFYIDGDNAHNIYKINAGRLPILLHTGDNRYEFSAPKRLASVASQYEKTTFIGAHFGGYSRWNEVECYKDTENVYFDTSSALFLLEKERAVSLIYKLGEHRFFFATDFPVTNHKDELDRFLALNLDQQTVQDILYNNVSRALKLNA